MQACVSHREHFLLKKQRERERLHPLRLKNRCSLKSGINLETLSLTHRGTSPRTPGTSSPAARAVRSWREESDTRGPHPGTCSPGYWGHVPVWCLWPSANLHKVSKASQQVWDSQNTQQADCTGVISLPNKQRKMPRDAGSVGRFRRATKLCQEVRSSFLKPNICSILLLVGVCSRLGALCWSFAVWSSPSRRTKAPAGHKLVFMFLCTKYKMN